jgi:hypothetical protein
MTDDRSLERAAQSWLEIGPVQAPDHAVDAALARIQTTRQERGQLIPWRVPTMNSASRLVAGLAAIAAVLVVGAFLVGPRLGPGGTTHPSPSPSPTATPVVTPGASPGPTASDAACRLIATTEAATAGDFPDVGTIATPSGTGAVTGCQYREAGINPIIDTEYTSSGGKAAFDLVKQRPGVQTVADIGTDAVFDPATATLYVSKGDALVSIVAAPTTATPAARLITESIFGKLVAGRI